MDSGAVEIASNAFWEATINQILQPGLYWISFLNSYQFTIRVIANAGGANAICGAVDGATVYGTYFTIAFGYADLPDPYPSEAGLSSITTVPYILMRVA